MKLMWFHLMPYTELPDDFNQKHPSVWVDIHSSLFDPRRAHHMYNDFMDELEYAAEVGFDAVCVNEHHSNGYGLMPSPNLIASSLARRTTDTALCVMGNSLALYNPPTRVAEEFAMIDCISGGRLIAGFPVGSPMDTCYAYGQNPSMLRERYYEAHDLVKKAWTEKETFAFSGRFNQQRYVNIWPRPIQNDPHPPIWIPGGGSIETWRWCAEMDYVYCYLSYYGYKAGLTTMQGFWNEMAKLGKDRNPYRAGFLQFVGVAESRQQALDLYSEPAEYFYGRCLHVDPRFALPPGYTTEATQRAGIEGMMTKAANLANPATKAALKATNMKDIVDGGYVLIGSPDEVVEQIRHVGNQPQRRPSHAAAAVRQHEQGHHQVQHADVRREGDAQGEGPVRRLGRQVVAQADGQGPARRRSGLPPAARRGGVILVSAPKAATVEVNGFPCRVWTKGSGPKLGFLAGLGGLPRWLPFLDRLAETRTVIVPSLPGYPGATGHTELDTHLDWVLAVRQLIDKAGLAGADLVGASVGGAFAAEMAAIFPVMSASSC